jgi:hypothetical protein
MYFHHSAAHLKLINCVLTQAGSRPAATWHMTLLSTA